jgi:hypothetical protein
MHRHMGVYKLGSGLYGMVSFHSNRKFKSRCQSERQYVYLRLAQQLEKMHHQFREGRKWLDPPDLLF